MIFPSIVWLNPPDSSPLPVMPEVGVAGGSVLCDMYRHLAVHIGVAFVRAPAVAAALAVFESAAAIRDRILEARTRQYQRLSPFGQFCNSRMTPRTLRRFCKLDAECEKQMENAITKTWPVGGDA